MMVHCRPPLLLKQRKGGNNNCHRLYHYNCRNPSLGLPTKARFCKVVGQERKLGSQRKCEGMNPHTPKGASTLGVGVLVDSRMFKERLQGPKLNGLRSSLYHWKIIET
jgi:hypothetical protein